MNPQNNPLGYNVHTESDVQAMLQTMGLRSIDDLFADVPASVRLNRPLNLPEPQPEWALMRELRQWSERNASTHTHACYLGGGAYEHHVPAVVDAMASRGEFLTAYTPYQPEMSQGLLQALYEFQTLVGRLLGLPSVNCSVYDGATALAESCWMMCAASGRRTVVVAKSMWQHSARVLQTYLEPRGVKLLWVDFVPESGRINHEALQLALAQSDVAGLALQTPNALGVVEDVQAVAALCKAHGVLLNVSANPLLFAWLESAGELGADIVCCEGQPLGLHLAAGGPYLGVIACTKALERHLPGRLVGRVHDLNGKLGYALVKEDREQHVARDKATSHICSNQALNAIRVAAYLACMGGSNLADLAHTNARNARSLAQRLNKLRGVMPLVTGDGFNEFAVLLPMPAPEFCAAMQELGIFAGLPVPNEWFGHSQGLLIAVTETKTEADLDHYAECAARVLSASTTAKRSTAALAEKAEV